jgi:RNA polymerase sigma-70 factor, ECF subfamily
MMAVSTHVYENNKRFIWGLCYRMTGNAADAEDMVQEAFVKALESPGLDTEQSLRPWLVRVAMNLSRDHLRRRRHQGYDGPWLPSPVPTDDETQQIQPVAPTVDSPATRYDLLESISLAFLLALEALTPAQRAVLLLRDVFDYSTTEAAELLAVTENTVRVTLYRARRVMQAYDRERMSFAQSRSEKTRLALERFVQCLRERDAEGLEQLLAEDVVVVSDGGGEVTALPSLMQGRQKVLQLTTRLNAVWGDRTQISFCVLNGLPAIIFERSNVKPGHATRFTLQCEVNGSGHIKQLNYVLTPSKLVLIETHLLPSR